MNVTSRFISSHYWPFNKFEIFSFLEYMRFIDYVVGVLVLAPVFTVSPDVFALSVKLLVN